MKKSLLIFIITFIFIFLSCDLINPTENDESTYKTGTVTDIDGNTYQTVKIGDQWWMAKNLKVIHYRNGDAIKNVIDNMEWKNLTTGSYCNYENYTANVGTYGRLYNWYAVNDSRGLAPEGWHVPTDEEWNELVTYLGSNAGNKLQEAGSNHWIWIIESDEYGDLILTNSDATNETGFTAVPGGYRSCDDGDYHKKGQEAYFWTSTGYNASQAWCWNIFLLGSVYHMSENKKNGFSVRCVKD